MGIGPYTISKEALAKIHAQRKKNKEEGIDFRLPKHVFTEERYIPEIIVPDFYKLPEIEPKHIPDLTIERIHSDGLKELSLHIWYHSISFLARDLHLLRKSYGDKDTFKIFSPIVRSPMFDAVPFDYTFNLTGHQGVVFRWENFLFDKRVLRSNYRFLVPKVPRRSVPSAHSSTFFPSTEYLWYINEFNASFFSQNPKIMIWNNYAFGKRLRYRSRYRYNEKRQYFRWWRLERWVRSSHYNRDYKLDNFIYKPFHFLYFTQAKCWRYFLLMCYFGEDLNADQSLKEITTWLSLTFARIWILFLKLIILILNTIAWLIEKSSLFWLILYEVLLHGYIGYVLKSSYFFNMIQILLHTNFMMLLWSIFLSTVFQPVIDGHLGDILVIVGNIFLVFPHFSAMMYQWWMLLVSFMHIGLLEMVSICVHTWNYFDAFFNIKFIAQQTLPYTTKAIILDLKEFYDLHNDLLLDVLFPKSNPDKLIRVKQLAALIYQLVYFMSERLTPYKRELIPIIRAHEMAVFRTVDLETVEFLLILNYLQLEKYYEYQRKKEYEISVEVEDVDKWYKEMQLEKTKERIFETLRDIDRLKTVQLEKIEELVNAGEFLYGMGIDPIYEVSFSDVDDNILDKSHEFEEIKEEDLLLDNNYDNYEHYEGIRLTDKFSTDDIPEEKIITELFSSIIPDGTILSNWFSSIIPDGTILSNWFSSIIPDGTILSNIFTNLNLDIEDFIIFFPYITEAI
jgi:hypothetical protein